MEENIKNLLKLLPEFEELKDIVKNENEAKYILKKTLDTLQFNTLENANTLEDIEEVSFLIEALVDRFWERIHTGHFSEVPLEIRKIYALACYLKIILLLLENHEDQQQLEKCSEILDQAMLIGCVEALYPKSQVFRDSVMDIFDQMLVPADLKLPVIEDSVRQSLTCVLTLKQPSVLEFQQKCFDVHKPALLLDTLNHWPALNKWRDLNYLLKLAGNRTVPIETGSNYANDEWSQQLMKIKDFLKTQFSDNVASATNKDIADIHYLAQHELFEQIPLLKKDFSVPDYCSLGKCTENVDIKAWLGPKGTISPMHYDPKHNLLCQVFGSKSIILASPEDTMSLYPHESEFLQNTSQIDAEQLDMEKFPLVAQVKFYHFILQPGDCLYIPPKWWHYVRSNSPSFSVSFWWD